MIFFFDSIDFRFDVIRWNFSNISACFRLWLCLFLSTCTIVYNCFHLWAYKRLSFIPLKGKSNAKPTNLCKIQLNLNYLEDFSVISVIFDWICFVGYCCYIGLFLYFPVHYILAENYPIVTRIIILIEQVRFSSLKTKISHSIEYYFLCRFDF
jgi:hypothetical protein